MMEVTMNNSITAVIPVKGNSTRLPNKNILPFAGTNLLEHKINQLKAVKGINEIICSSDSDEMLAIADKCGIKAIKRPKQYADESVPFGMFLEYLCGIVEGDHILYACATSPCVEPYLYEKAIKTYFEKLEEGYDSLITVTPYQTYLMDDNGPINFKMGLEHKNSEQLPMMYHFTNGIDIAPTDRIKEWHYNYGPKYYQLIVNKREAADIDDVYDYEIAKALWAMKDPKPTI